MAEPDEREVRAGDEMRPGALRRAGGALLEELSRPRARARRALRRARNVLGSWPRSSVAVLVLLAVALLLLYVVGAGPARGLAAGGTFLGVFLALALGGPLLLVYAWPAVVAAAAGLLIWSVSALGPGAAWLWAATLSASLLVYLASPELAPLVGAAGLARLALELGRATGIVVFVLALGLFYWAKRRLSASILAAAWAGLAGWVAAVAAEPSSPDWTPGMLPGPRGLLLWVAVAALVAAGLVWPRRRGRGVTADGFD